MMDYMMTMFRYLKSQKGQGMVEYVLIITVIALVVVAAMPTLTAAISSAFGNAAGKM